MALEEMHNLWHNSGGLGVVSTKQGFDIFPKYSLVSLLTRIFTEHDVLIPQRNTSFLANYFTGIESGGTLNRGMNLEASPTFSIDLSLARTGKCAG